MGNQQLATSMRSHSEIPYWRVENFLCPSDRLKLFNALRVHENEILQATTTTGEENFRAAYVLYDVPEAFPLLRELIECCVPVVTRAFLMQDFIPSRIEMQLTAYAGRGFFRRHRDNTNVITSNRIISFVYYFHKIPKRFTGGQLVLFGDGVKQSTGEEPPTQVIDPVDNTIVFFKSRQPHEVLMVTCESNAIEESRLSVNGWIRY